MDYFSHIASEQQQQSQRQRQQEPPQPYDLAQPHLHDPYYGYHHQRSYDTAAAVAASSHDQYYFHYYYPPEHAASHHHQWRPVAAQLDPAAASGLLRDASQGMPHRGGGGGGPAGAPGDGEDQRGAYPAPPGMNPAAAAAVAALSQLVQTMDAAERTGAGGQERWQQDVVEPGMRSHMMPAPPHPYEYPVEAGGMHRRAGGRAPRRIGGRNGPFRGRGNGNKAGFVHRPTRSDGRALFRGRGRGARIGRGRGRQSNQLVSEVQSDSPANEAITEPESADARVSVPAQALPQQPFPPLAWCDICRVGCNSLEILEQHKNGKRHKKTIHRLQEMQAQQKLLTETQGQPCMQGVDESQTQPQLESQEKVIDGDSVTSVIKLAGGIIQEVKADNIDESQTQPSTISENLQEALTGENIIKTESQGQAVVELSEGRKKDDFGGKNTPKRKIQRFGRGGKRLRTSQPMSRKQARPKEQPRVCTLCNVICETQAVFDSHSAGKKHCSRIKRFQGQAVYGPLNVYIPPNQPLIYDPSGPQPLYFGLQTQGMVPLTAYEPQQLSETFGLPQQEQGGQAIPMPLVEHSRDQNAVSASEAGKAVVAAGVAPGDAFTEAQSVFASTKDSETAFETGDAVEAEAGSATEGGVLEADNVITTEDADGKAETGLVSGEDIPAPDYGVASAENVIPGLDIQGSRIQC